VLFSVPALAATVNVVTHGAVGTGNEADAATNQTAFAAAIAAANSGDTVYFPPGVYYLDGDVSVPTRGISVNKAGLTLDGYGATIKRVTSDATPLVMIGWGWGDNGSVIQGLTIDGNRSAYEGGSFGIYASHSTDLTIIDCNIINNASDGIYISAEHDDTYGPNYKKGYATIENCTINNNYRNGLSITNSSGGCVVKDSDFTGNDLVGLDIEPEWHHTSNHLISGCTFDKDRLNLYGVEPHTRPWDITIEDCNFINGAELVSHLSMDITATNNTFTGAGGSIFFNGFYGETYGGCGKIALTGNSVEGVTNNGINLLVNPSFDSWTAGTADNWTAVGTGTYNIEPSEARALEGVEAAHLSAAGGTAELKQTIAVSAGNYYTFGGYISRGPISGSTHPAISVKFLDGGLSVLKTIEVRAYYEYEKYAIYEKVMGIVEAPAGAVSAEVIVGSQTSGSFDAYFDGLFFFAGVGPDGGDLTESDNKVMRFDFGQKPGVTPGFDSPAPGYIHVDSTTAYAFDPDTGLTYGVFSDANSIVSEFSHAAFQTRHSGTWLSVDGLRFHNADGLSSSGFELEVPNGTYLVTVAGGSISTNLKGYLVVEGQAYFGDQNSENMNLYMVDVNPDQDGGGVPDGFLTWTQDQNFSKHAPVSALFGVQTWGMGSVSIGQELYDAAEFLYLQDQPITVTDGKLTVYGVSTTESGTELRYLLSFLEVVAVSPQNCNQVQEFDFGLLGDFNQDCVVDYADLFEMVNNWLVCNMPNDLNCIETL
jgi:parallel beta-helix repeat protein